MTLLYDVLQWFRGLLPALVIPPMGLVCLALLGLALTYWRRRTGTIVTGISLVALYAIGTPAVSHLLMRGLESRPPQGVPTAMPAAIVVLGGDGELVYGVPGNAEPGPLSLERLVGGADLARHTGLPILITGGVVGADQPPVAELMARTMSENFGLPVAWREDRSENTCENAHFSADILRDAQIPSAWVVTHSWHMPRALLSFAHANYPVVPAPLPVEIFAIRGFSDFLPHIKAWTRSYYAFHEWIGLVAYRMGACP